MDDSNQLTPYEEIGPTRRSTCSDEPSGSLKPSAAIQHLIAQIGLRYRPSNLTDLEAHTAMLALLACDVADIDPRDLDVAIRQHVKHSPFMPKACELIELANAAVIDRYWRENPKQEAIEYQPPPEPEPIIPCTPEEAAAIMQEFGIPSILRHGVKLTEFVDNPPDGTTEHYVDRAI